MIRRQTEELLMSLRHQYLSPNQSWVLTLIAHMEDHIWTDSVTGGDLWNGRWTRDSIQKLLPDSSMACIVTSSNRWPGCANSLESFRRANKGCMAYGAQNFSPRRPKRNMRHPSLQKKRNIRRSQTLFDVWKIHYCRPLSP